MKISVKSAGAEQAGEVHRIMQSAFEEYRGRLSPASGALRETVEDVRAAILEGGALLAFADELAVGSARYQLYPEFAYAGRVAVLPGYRGHGIATALIAAFEDMARARGLPETHIGVRASLPANLRFYENLGYRALSSKSFPNGSDYNLTLNKPL